MACNREPYRLVLIALGPIMLHVQRLAERGGMQEPMCLIVTSPKRGEIGGHVILSRIHRSTLELQGTTLQREARRISHALPIFTPAVYRT